VRVKVNRVYYVEVNCLSLKEFKLFLILGVFLGLLIVSVYVVSAYWPRYEEYFLSWVYSARRRKLRIIFQVITLQFI